MFWHGAPHHWRGTHIRIPSRVISQDTQAFYIRVPDTRHSQPPKSISQVPAAVCCTIPVRTHEAHTRWEPQNKNRAHTHTHTDTHIPPAGRGGIQPPGWSQRTPAVVVFFGGKDCPGASWLARMAEAFRADLPRISAEPSVQGWASGQAHCLIHLALDIPFVAGTIGMAGLADLAFSMFWGAHFANPWQWPPVVILFTNQVLVGRRRVATSPTNGVAGGKKDAQHYANGVTIAQWLPLCSA